MQDYVEINGIDVTEKRIMWEYISEWKYAIDSLNIDFSPSLLDLIPTLATGMRIKVKRGFVTPTDEFIIDGDITQVKPQADRISLVCKGRMIDAVKAGRVKSWDKDIDVEQGIGSEIFKTICSDCSLNYDSTTIPSTGTADADKVVKFIQNDEDNFEMMNRLTELYERVITYDYDQGKVYWQDRGITDYGHPLVVGVDIQNQIKWKENMEQLINKVKVHGATVYDKINPAVFAGPATIFQLTRTPEDTEVRQDSGTGALYRRGQKGVGTIGTDFDYYVDVEQKQIIFGTNKSNIWVRYGAQVPMPIVATNPVSIEQYGGPNQIPHFKSFTFSDLKDVNDAEDRARTILNKYSTPFWETREDVQIQDETIQTYGLIKPGYLVNVIDSFNNKNMNLFVKIVSKSFPHIGDRITIGDEIWRTEDWQTEQMKKINLLFNNLNKNQDILITTIDNTEDITYENRYMYFEKLNIAGETGFYGNAAKGIYGLSKYGTYASLSAFILGSPISGLLGINKLGSGALFWETVRLLQGDDTYKELIGDDVFYDNVNSTGVTWNTTTKTITIANAGILYTNALVLGETFNYATISFANIAGNYNVYISANGKANWQALTLNTKTALINKDTTGIYLRIEDALVPTFPITFPMGFSSIFTLSNTYDAGGNISLPAIKLILEE